MISHTTLAIANTCMTRSGVVLQALRALMFSIVVMCAVVLAAGFAHAADWVVNINDTGSDPIAAGGTIVYNVRVDNLLTSAAPSTPITLDIPAGGVFTGATGTITGCTPTPATGPASVVCTVPALAGEAIANMQVSILTSAAGNITLTATIPPDDDNDNNIGSQGTTITAGANLQLQVTGPATTASGSSASYTFTTTNLGPNTGGNMTLTIPAPTGLTNIVVPPTCTLVGPNYVCTISGPLANGGTVDLIFSGTVSAAATSTVTVVGSVVGNDVTDPITSNNTDDTNTSITAGTDLTIGKSRSPSGTLLVGGSAIFTLTPSYTGDSPSMMTITDTIPANYDINSVTPAIGSGWTCTVVGQVITCDRTSGSGAGANVSLGSIEIDTTIVSSGSPVNSATIGAVGPIDPNPGNNTATDGGATILDPSADLRANKTGPTAPALVVLGNTYDFNISTTNLGNAPFVGTVVMEDALPAGLEVTSYGLNGWSCSPAATVVGATTITCQRVYTAGAPLAVGGTTPVVQLTSLVTASGSISNGLRVSSPDANYPDPDPLNDVINYGVTSIAAGSAADISVLKRRSLATLPAGDIQTFELEVVNAGPSTSTGIVLTDDITSLINGNEAPTGAGFIDSVATDNAATGVSCSNSTSGGTSRYLSCAIDSLPVCTAGTDCPIITVRVRPGGDAGTRTNYANAISNDVADSNLGNNSGNASYDVEARADVTVAKVGSPDPATAGQNLTYVVTATNVANGLSSSENTTVIDTLPNNVTFVSASPSSGSCSTTPTVGSTTGAGNNQVICNFGTIGNGAQQTLTVLVRPNFNTRGTTITNVADISTSTLGDNSGNNSASAPIPVGNPVLDLLVNKSDSADPTPVGEDMVYTMVVTNNGPSTAENVVVTDNLPTSRLTFVSHTVPADGTCSSVPAVGSFSGTLRCSFPRMVAGETRTLTVTMNGDAKGVTTNTVNVTSDEVLAGFDSLTTNNNDAENTTVRTRVDIQVASKIATPATVSLREPFNFAIVVRNNAGALLGDADNVVLTDNLPANMVLVGAPSAIVSSGSTTLNTCTGVSGDVGFTCSFGTLSNPSEISITVPVMVTATSAQPQTFTNSASVASSSYDINSANNSNSGNVDVNSSSISGTVYRDFSNNGAEDGSDTGVSGIPMTLSGLASDGVTAISLVVNTDSNGNYTFPFLPSGNYTVTRGTISEVHLAAGQSLPGPNGGGSVTPTVINAISLADNTAAPEYDFTVIPQARIGIAKSVVAGPTTNVDGSFNVTFRLVVNNFSLEGLTNVAVTDALAGGSPLFGTHQSLGTPATDPLSLGQYTILSAPFGTCGGTNGSFTGSADTTVASGFAMTAASSCTIDFALRAQPTNPLPSILASGGRYDNQAQVTGEGVLSGQTSASNPLLSDLSDNGATADTNSNGQANDAGENDPTPVSPVMSPAITLVKTGTPILGANGQIDAGEEIDYEFVVTNSGDVTLTSISVLDPVVGTVNCPVTTLNPGISTTCTGTYLVTQADINAGVKVNTATASGTPPAGAAVTDVSDGAIAGPLNNDDTQTPLTQVPRITLVKEAAAPTVAEGVSITETDADDTIDYTFTVANAGNVPLTAVSVTDAKVGPVTCLVNALAVGESTTCSATYTITQADMNAGEVENTATANGTSPLNVVVNDISDETTPGPGVGNDDPTITPLAQTPRISLVKNIGAITDLDGNGTDVDDTISYVFTVTNSGTVTLNTVGVTDAKVANITCVATTLLPAEQTTCTGDDYVITLADVNAGSVENTATASGIPPATPSNPTPSAVTDISDEATPGAGAGNDDPTITPLGQNPAITLVKTASVPTVNLGLNTTIADVDDTIDYSFLVTNTGNVTLSPVDVTDTKIGAVTCPVATLLPGEFTTCTAQYTIALVDVDAGQVENTATAFGTPPATPSNPTPARVQDISDELTPGAGVGNDDPTITPLGQTPSITLVKTASAPTVAQGADATIPDIDDTIDYSFLVTNTGNVTLSPIDVTDVKVGTVTCPVTSLAPGVATTCTAQYTVALIDMDAGEVENTATAFGTPPATPSNPTPARVSDISDELTPGPGVGNDDPTITPLTQTPRISLIKNIGAITDLDANGTDADDTIAYVFTVTNTGTVTLNTVGVSDAKVANITCVATTLLPSEQTTCTGDDYIITQADVNTGSVENTATASGIPPATPANPTPTAVTDISDELTPGTGAGNDDPTITPLGQNPAITLVKTASVPTIALGANTTIADIGDTIDYSFLVTNSGNVTLSPVDVVDTKVGAVTCPVTTLLPGEATTCTAQYTIALIDVDAGQVENTATANGTPPATPSNPTPARVSDISDETTPGAGIGNDDPTITPLGQIPAITLVKTASAPSIALGVNATIPDVDDTIDYSFVVTNTGNVTLSPIDVTDAKVGTVTCPVTSLAPGVATTCTAQYTIALIDMDAGEVENTATAFGTPPATPSNPTPARVSDISDETTPGPGVGNDDPTITPLTQTPRISLVKTATVPTVSKGADAEIPDVGDTIDYSFVVKNAGSVTLKNVAITDPKVGAVNCPVATLAPNVSTTCSAQYVLTQDDINLGSVTNTATVSGTPPLGEPVTDISGSTVGNDNPTVTQIPRVPRLGLVKEMTGTKDIDKNGFVTVGDKLLYTVTATNTGNVSQSNVVVTDSKITPASKTCTTLLPSQTCVLKGELTVSNADLRGGGVKNVAQVVSDEVSAALQAETNTPVFPIVQPEQFTKVAQIAKAKRGERVPYVIEAIDVPLNPVRIVDIMPPGFSYVAGSAKANGTSVTPTIKGQSLIFNGLAPDAGDDLKLELTLIANAGAATGPAVNKAQLIYPNSGTLLATAQATVTIIAEPVFDCGDVIGKVFDDRNGNGIQDAETSPYIPERGLAGVRIATVRGHLVTTDKNGLFHVPCADIPDGDIGSNFIMKLDTRTLPTGYRLTTENPRKVRLTRGKMTKINFGASITRVVTLDLNAQVFEQGSVQLRAKWSEGLLKLVATLEQEPSTLRINYVGTSDKALARARMQEVSKHIKSIWAKKKGRYRLPIETRAISAEGQAVQ